MTRFADAAARLAGLAGVTFGWAPAVFWSSTPAELGALVHVLASDEGLPPDRDALARLKEQFPDG